MLGGRLADSILRASHRFKATLLGWTYGVVVDNRDPEGAGRIRVRLPWHDRGVSSDWIPKHAGWGGHQAGETYSVPEIGEVVRVTFLGGDLARPAYGPAIWRPKDPQGATAPSGDWTDGAAKPMEPLYALQDDYAPQIGEDRADVVRGRDMGSGTWRHWHKAFKAIGNRLVFILNDRHIGGTWTLDASHRTDGEDHALEARTPKGDYVRIREGQGGRTWELQAAQTLKITLTKGNGGLIVTVDTDHAHILIDDGARKIQVSDGHGNTTTMDSGGVVLQSPIKVHIQAPQVILGSGGPPVARVGDLVQVGPNIGVIISGSGTTVSS